MTTYYFEVESSAMDKTLDIFSRFFIDPLLKSEMINREVNAVNSEYENDLQSDVWRFLELLRRVSNPAHPFHYFHIGNKNTLKDMPENNINLREQLVKFFKDYYSSHLMTLAVVGPDSLDELEKMTVEKFSIIPNRKNPPPKHLESVGIAFPTSHLGKFVWYRPVAKEKLLHIVFPISSYIPNTNQVRPLDFIEYFLDYSGSGSFKEFAREKGWINGLKTMVSSKYSDFTLFRVHFKLTEYGMNKIHEILDAFFAYLKKIKSDGN
jgi:insulysin